jgi:pimeloyl-ACP methyl ester carboxylesterase
MRRYAGAVLLGALLAAAFSASPAFARDELRNDPVIVLHGLDAEPPASANCNWLNRVSSSLRAWGWTAPITRLAYYADTNCDDSLGHHGSHTVHFGSGHSAGFHTEQTPIEHLGYHLAWFIYDHYSRNGVAVDVVGHSMGGLIIRYALARTAARDAHFPPYLRVEDVVTGGSPHLGFAPPFAPCYTSYECRELLYGSAFLNQMAATGSNPQGLGGTDWTTEGSWADAVVSSDSATGMPASHKVSWEKYQGIDHDGFISDAATASDADAEWTTGTTTSWTASSNTLHPIRWADRALMSGSW